MVEFKSEYFYYYFGKERFHCTSNYSIPKPWIFKIKNCSNIFFILIQLCKFLAIDSKVIFLYNLKLYFLRYWRRVVLEDNQNQNKLRWLSKWKGLFPFKKIVGSRSLLTFSWRRSLSNRNQSIGFLCKSMDYFLYDRDHHHERVNGCEFRKYFAIFSLKESTSLAKYLSVRLRIKWLWVRVPLQSESTYGKSNGNVYMNLYRLTS